jgi:hypothetical protein
MRRPAGGDATKVGDDDVLWWCRVGWGLRPSPRAGGERASNRGVFWGDAVRMDAARGQANVVEEGEISSGTEAGSGGQREDEEGDGGGGDDGGREGRDGRK